jgi:hypothetical protein
MKIAVHLDPHPAQATTQKAPAAIKELADIDPERAKAAGITPDDLKTAQKLFDVGLNNGWITKQEYQEVPFCVGPART